jgi:hypothetical protein
MVRAPSRRVAGRQDPEFAVLDLRGLPASKAPDQEADEEEGARRQQQKRGGMVPAAGGDGRQDFDAQQAARAEQLPQGTDQDQNPAIAQGVAQAVQDTQTDTILHREGLRPSHDDAVGHDEPDEHRKLLAEPVGVSLQDLVHDDHQRRDDRDLHDQTDIPWHVSADQADQGV